MDGKQMQLMEKTSESAIKRTELQALVQKHVKEISEIMKLSFAQVRELGRMQNNVKQSMSELMNFEREYVNCVMTEHDMRILEKAEKDSLYESS
jgi:hypothetical protein